MMNVLVLGSGGRESALAHRLLRDPSLQTLHMVPGTYFSLS